MKIILILFTYPHVLPILSVKLLTKEVFFHVNILQDNNVHKDMNNDLKKVFWGFHYSLKKANSKNVVFFKI